MRFDDLGSIWSHSFVWRNNYHIYFLNDQLDNSKHETMITLKCKLLENHFRLESIRASTISLLCFVCFPRFGFLRTSRTWTICPGNVDKYLTSSLISSPRKFLFLTFFAYIKSTCSYDLNFLCHHKSMSIHNMLWKSSSVGQTWVNLLR